MSSYNINNTYWRPTAGVVGQSSVVSSSVVTLFATAPSLSTKFAIVDVQLADVMVTFGGETPSTTAGMRWAFGKQYPLSIGAALSAKFIQASSSSTLYTTEWTM